MTSERTVGTVLVAHPSPDLYGSDRVVVSTVEACATDGVRVVVVLPHEGPLVPLLRNAGAEVRICDAPVLRRSALSPRGLLILGWQVVAAWPRMTQLIRSVDPDVVIVNTITTPLWMAAGRLSRRTVLCHVHEAEPPSLLRRFLYAPVHLAHLVVVNSRFTATAVADAWRSLDRRCVVVPNSVAGPGRTEPPGARPEVTRLLYVGRLSPRKGPQVAVEALRLLRAMGREAHLTLVGAVFEGYEWFEEQLVAQIDAGDLNDHVTLAGFDSDVWPHFAACDIVLVPSIQNESFGNTAVEAMLAQRPLVVSDMSGLVEAASGYGAVRWVPPNDAAAVADAVVDLVDSWDRSTSSLGSDRALAQERHAPPAYGRRLLEVIRASHQATA